MADKVKGDTADELQKLLSAFVKERITPADFIAAFKKVIEHVQNMQKLTVSHLRVIHDAVNAAATTIAKGNHEQLASLYAELASSIEEHKDSLDKSHAAALQRLETAISGITNGKDADEDVIVEKVLAKIPPHPELPVGEDYRNALEALQGYDQLDLGAVRGLKDLIQKIQDRLDGHAVVIGNTPGSGLADSSGNIGRFQYLKFPGATITHQDDTATITISGSSSNSVYGEVPTDSGDHTNFTIAHTPTAGSFRVYRGGARQIITSDYTQSGTALVLSSPLATGELLIVDYNY